MKTRPRAQEPTNIDEDEIQGEKGDKQTALETLYKVKDGKTTCVIFSCAKRWTHALSAFLVLKEVKKRSSTFNT